VTASCQSVRTSPALRLHLQVVPRKYGGPLSATTCRRGRLWRGWGKRKNRERRAGGLLRLGSFSLPPATAIRFACQPVPGIPSPWPRRSSAPSPLRSDAQRRAGDTLLLYDPTALPLSSPAEWPSCRSSARASSHRAGARVLPATHALLRPHQDKSAFLLFPSSPFLSALSPSSHLSSWCQTLDLLAVPQLAAFAKSQCVVPCRAVSFAHFLCLLPFQLLWIRCCFI
jgi:hypothetical protein